MEEIYVYIFLLFLFELYETNWQKGHTIKEIIFNIYLKYKQGIFYFLFSHPSFIFLLYIAIKENITNFWLMSAIFLKFLDISYKLSLVKKIEENRLSELLPIPLDTKVESLINYFNIIFYPLALYMAFIT
jgi:hypothetical protein